MRSSVVFTCYLELPKTWLASVFRVRHGGAHFKTSAALAPATNCRKNALISWFAGTGGCSILHADGNSVPQTKQRSASLSFHSSHNVLMASVQYDFLNLCCAFVITHVVIIK